MVMYFYPANMEIITTTTIIIIERVCYFRLLLSRKAFRNNPLSSSVFFSFFFVSLSLSLSLAYTLSPFLALK
jgi:hypothetical protein